MVPWSYRDGWHAIGLGMSIGNACFSPDGWDEVRMCIDAIWRDCHWERLVSIDVQVFPLKGKLKRATMIVNAAIVYKKSVLAYNR